MSEHTDAQLAIKNANRATKHGNLAEAERWSKIADRLSTAAARLAANPPPQDEDDEEEAEARRAELRRRIQAFVDGATEIEAWESAKVEYEAACKQARAAGAPLPPPMPPHPAGASHMSEAYLTSIAKGED